MSEQEEWTALDEVLATVIRKDGGDQLPDIDPLVVVSQNAQQIEVQVSHERHYTIEVHPGFRAHVGYASGRLVGFIMRIGLGELIENHPGLRAAIDAEMRRRTEYRAANCDEARENYLADRADRDGGAGVGTT